MEWLNKNPIVGDAEVGFIKEQISIAITVPERAAEAKPQSSNKGGSWIGKYPHLWLIHSVLDENEIKRACLSRLNVPGDRMALENPNTPKARAANVWQMVAMKRNDPTFLPVTSVKPETHSDFSLPIALSFESVNKLQPATADKVESKWNEMVLALKRGIQNWERSGQGYGGFMEEEEIVSEDSDEEKEENNEDNEDDDDAARFGSLKQCTQAALNNHSNFFDGRASYLLYLWDMLEEHGLMQSSVQQLHDGIRSGDGGVGVPATIGEKRKRDDDISLLSKSTSKQYLVSSSIEKHGESIVFLAKTVASENEKNRQDARKEREKVPQETLLREEKIREETREREERNNNNSRANDIRARINSLHDSKHAMVLRMTELSVTGNKDVSNTLKEEIKGIEEEIQMNAEELNMILTTPKKKNHSPVRN